MRGSAPQRALTVRIFLADMGMRIAQALAAPRAAAAGALPASGVVAQRSADAGPAPVPTCAHGISGVHAAVAGGRQRPHGRQPAFHRRRRPAMSAGAHPFVENRK
ncbi:hypothetical protein [Xanthomonas sp.]|uniref:hypothetical protein n=1 Tax=Xanthomonas sp. TaxID=29446 RepID=UPI0019825398|nr:hypothetical protein [Xanthomonas sp.]